MKYECKILLDIYMTHETIWQILYQLEMCARLPKSHWRSLDSVWILNKKNTVGFTDLNPMPQYFIQHKNAYKKWKKLSYKS